MLIPTSISILARVLAATDVLWAPYRARPIAADPSLAAIYERRREFLGEGVEVRAEGTVAARKSFERSLDELQRLGLIILSSGAGRFPGLKLTASGDDLARELCDARPLYASGKIFARIAAATLAADSWLNDGFVCEVHVVGTEDTQALVDFEVDCLALLSRGLVESNSDTCGGLGYRITSLGLAGPGVRAAGTPASPSPALTEKFCELYTAGLLRRDSWKPARAGHLGIPMSRGMWGPQTTPADHAIDIEGDE